MAVRFIGNMNAIANQFRDAQNDIIQRYVRALRDCGERCVNEAKTAAGYNDITGNLRASIGYVVIVNGRIVDEKFEGVQEGVSEGKKFIEELLRLQTEIALVVVAGMNYASYVETKGKNVLTSSEQLAKVIVPDILRQLR